MPSLMIYYLLLLLSTADKRFGDIQVLSTASRDIDDILVLLSTADRGIDD